MKEMGGVRGVRAGCHFRSSSKSINRKLGFLQKRLFSFGSWRHGCPAPAPALTLFSGKRSLFQNINSFTSTTDILLKLQEVSVH